MRNLCVIPARGGSKRIPKKNIRDFLGKPIIAYSIQAALTSNLFDEVMVSTDDEEISQIALEHGAQVPFKRHPDTAHDHATTFEVIEEVLNTYQSLGKDFDTICCLYPCSPFVTAEKLHSAYKRLIEDDLDVVFPIVAFGFPIQRALKQNGGTIAFVHPEFAQTRSQDLEKRYHDTGQFYLAKVSELLQKRSFVTENTGGIVVEETECQDIDNETDWKIAEIKYQIYAQ